MRVASQGGWVDCGVGDWLGRRGVWVLGERVSVHVEWE